DTVRHPPRLPPRPLRRKILKISQQAHLGGKPRPPCLYNETDFAPAVCGIVKMPAAAARISPAGGLGVPRHRQMDATKLNPKIDVPADALKILAELSQEINASLNLDEVLPNAAKLIKRLVD